LKTETPGYVSALLRPIPGQATDRKVWSIPLGGVWVPFLTATNAAGETAIPAEALGNPLRLALEKDGTPKFSTSGRPVFRVAKEVADQVRIVKDNFVAGLMAYTESVAKGMPAQFKNQVEAALKAGEPLAQKDADTLADYAASQTPEAAPVSEAEKVLATA